MSTALRKPMTLDEFLAWEERQDLRHEFDGFQPVAMTGGSYAHDAIAMNLARELGVRLRGTPCRPHGSNFKLRTHTTVRYPDAFVSCRRYGNADTLARDPVVIFEVLSPSTAATDRIDKLREYTSLPSVRRYVLLEQDRIAATVLERDDERWLTAVLTDDAVLHMPEIGVELPLPDLYDGIAFEPAPAPCCAAISPPWPTCWPGTAWRCART